MRLNVNQLKTGVMLSYISRIITIVIGLLYTPVMIRLLGQSEYGLYNIAASVIAYLGVLNFGFGSAYMRFYLRYKVKDDGDKIATLNGMFVTIFSILGILAVIAGVIIAFNVNLVFGASLSFQELTTTRLLILVLVVNLAISFPVIIFNTYIQANEKFIFQNIMQIIMQVTGPLFSLPFLISGYGSVGMVFGTTIVNIIIELIIIFYCFRMLKMKFAFRNFDRDLMKEMTVYSSYIFINMVVDQVNNNMDKTILGSYQGTISVAIYSIAANLRLYYQQISSTISNVFTPRIHRMIAQNTDDQELTELFTRVGRIQFIILSLIMSGFIFFGRPFIGLWAGKDYYESYIIALILMIPITIPLIQNIGIEIQRAKNMHQFRSWIYLFMALGNLIISIPLSLRFGGVGAAFGTALSMIIGNGLAMNWYNHTKIGLNMGYFWKQILKFVPALIIPIIYGITINLFVNLYTFFNFLIYGMIYVGLFLASMWFFGMNDYERMQLKNPFK